MTILIFGCGYLGQRLAALWLAQGHCVYVTTRKEEKALQFRRQGFTPILCDVLDPDSLIKVPAVDCLVYAVGRDRTTAKSPREVYVEGLHHLLDTVSFPPRFLYISSTSVYGQHNGEWVDESAPTEPTEESGRVLLEAESLLHRTLPGAIILRFAGIYGPGRLLRRQAIEEHQTLGGDPDQWLNLIHVNDGAAAILATEQRAQPGAVYNVSDGHPVRRRDFYATLAALLKAPEPRFGSAVQSSSLFGTEPANRRIVNRRLLEELKVDLHYPSWVKGLTASLDLA
jgi:nucleoside-diphosphate-sugar epimerase